MERTNTNPHVLTIGLEENKFFPNSQLPALVYKEVLLLPNQKNVAAAIVQKIFLRHKWTNSWKNGIYDFHHYHSNTHECLGIAAGKVKVILGGPGGRRLEFKKGDVIIIPAGVGHKCVEASSDFICIGAYPQGKNYDINHGKKEELALALKNIKKLGIPKTDPLFGKEGFLKSFWK